MEPRRGLEDRNRQLPKISVGEKRRAQPQTDFEGMNYEQKRTPYNEKAEQRVSRKEHIDRNKRFNEKKAEDESNS